MVNHLAPLDGHRAREHSALLLVAPGRHIGKLHPMICPVKGAFPTAKPMLIRQALGILLEVKL